MIIVYLSIGLFVISLIYLGYTAFKTFKDMKPDIKRVQDTTVRIQKKADKIKVEMNQLTQTQREIQTDIEKKKQTVNEIVESAKETPRLLKQVWEEGKRVPPLSHLKRHPSTDTSEIAKFSGRVLSLVEKKLDAKTSK